MRSKNLTQTADLGLGRDHLSLAYRRLLEAGEPALANRVAALKREADMRLEEVRAAGTATEAGGHFRVG